MADRLLRVAEASERYGLAQGTLRKWVAQRKVPVVRLGRAVRLREGDQEAHVRVGLQEARRGGGRADVAPRHGEREREAADPDRRSSRQVPR
jgi:excisionase family DNA binding protein